jgi:hypothetical protein
LDSGNESVGREDFFFEKKKQKTFAHLGRGLWRPSAHAANEKSLFASFSSEKEGLPFFFRKG